MTTKFVAGALLIALPLAYNLLYTLLARSFDYPDILRQPTAKVLARFEEGGSRLLLVWWGFAMSAVLLAPTALLMSAILTDADSTVLSLASAVGVLAALVQFLGLIRWPFVVPYLARTLADPAATTATKDAVDVAFQTLNRYLGVAVGEHLGYLFTGAWTGLIALAVVQSDLLHAAFGVIGLILTPFFILCSFEFLGPFEPKGWKLAATLVPATYVAWSLWLMATGIAVLVG